jgi:hypothetical protein
VRRAFIGLPEKLREESPVILGGFCVRQTLEHHTEVPVGFPLARACSLDEANGLEPYHYFRYLFTHLPTANGEEDLAKLLPMNLRPTDLLDL